MAGRERARLRMFETGAAKSAGWLAALASVANPDTVKSVLRLDPETVCGGILVYIFVIAPATMGHEYNDIMGEVVKNVWPLALAYLAPLSGKLSERIIEKINILRRPSNG